MAFNFSSSIVSMTFEDSGEAERVEVSVGVGVGVKVGVGVTEGVGNSEFFCFAEQPIKVAVAVKINTKNKMIHFLHFSFKRLFILRIPPDLDYIFYYNKKLFTYGIIASDFGLGEGLTTLTANMIDNYIVYLCLEKNYTK